MPLLILAYLCSMAFAEAADGTHLTAMPTYVYGRAPGALGLDAEDEIWRPDKWKDRRIFNRFVPAMEWKSRPDELWLYFGNELGDMLWQELANAGEEPNRTPMILGGFNARLPGEFYAAAEFNQIDHFSEATFGIRKKRINSQKFSWFGENLPAYSGLWGELGYYGSGGFFKKASAAAGSEYVWAWDESEWVPIRISPRFEGNASFYFMEKDIELNAASEGESNYFGLRLKGESAGGGFYASRASGKENLSAWTDFSHSFFGAFANKGFIVLGAQRERKPLSAAFADSLEYKMGISNPTDLTLGVLLQQNGAKAYSEVSYKSMPFLAGTRIYQNYAEDFESVGFDSRLSYKSRRAEAGMAYSREFFDYYREHVFYDIKPAESSARIFLKYRFLESLSFAHEWVYRGEIGNNLNPPGFEPVRSVPAAWFWNAQAEQRIPEWNASLYAVLLNVLSKDGKEFSFGGANSAKFYCGINAAL